MILQYLFSSNDGKPSLVMALFIAERHELGAIREHIQDLTPEVLVVRVDLFVRPTFQVILC